MNRYDHVILAGASFGALGAPGAKDREGNPVDYTHWKQTFEDHLATAFDLHGIKDVYILEHRNCGAYRALLGKEFNDDQADEEEACHRKYADLLKKWIENWAKQAGTKLGVKSFLMDLRGRVTLLAPIKRQSSRRKRKSR